MSPSGIGGFTKSTRKTFFDNIEKSSGKMPGPATYDRMRIFDNKQAIDYSKRLQTSVNSGYNTTLGFSNNSGE